MWLTRQKTQSQPRAKRKKRPSPGEPVEKGNITSGSPNKGWVLLPVGSERAYDEQIAKNIGVRRKRYMIRRFRVSNAIKTVERGRSASRERLFKRSGGYMTNERRINKGMVRVMCR